MLQGDLQSGAVPSKHPAIQTYMRDLQCAHLVYSGVRLTDREKQEEDPIARGFVGTIQYTLL